MKLFYETISPDLHKYLKRLMGCRAFNDFYLVGGTALSLQLGHRISVDIDLFTPINYGNVNTSSISLCLRKLFPIAKNIESLEERQMVYSIFIGDTENTIVKLDLCYDERPIFPVLEVDGIRLLSDKDIAAMKLLAVVTGSRRKDYWDIYELLDKYELKDMIGWCLRRNPYTIEASEILSSLKNVWNVRESFDVVDFKNRNWTIIADYIESVASRLLL